MKQETTEQHDCTAYMSGENTNNRKRKKETTEQCDCRLAKAQERARLKRAEESMEQ